MSARSTPRSLRVERMGRAPYGRMLALQQHRHAEVDAGAVDDTLFLLEHDPVVTLGRNTRAGHILASQANLQARGVAVHETGRGGDVTFHGPGQVVGYPIVSLQPPERDIKGYVWCLEEILIRTAADFGVTAERIEGLRGIWVGREKIAAIGVRIARWTTMHGFALNVDVDLAAFRLIVPCGLHDMGVTSLGRLLGEPPPIEQVEERLIAHSETVLQRTAYRATASALPASALALRPPAAARLEDSR